MSDFSFSPIFLFLKEASNEFPESSDISMENRYFYDGNRYYIIDFEEGNLKLIECDLIEAIKNSNSTIGIYMRINGSVTPNKDLVTSYGVMSDTEFRIFLDSYQSI